MHKLSSKHLRTIFLKKKSKGFTLIEILIVVSIIAILVVMFTVSFRQQRLKAEDTRTRNDLRLLKIAFEDYYNDNNCYPPAAWLSTCESTSLAPYLSNIPCQANRDPFIVEYDVTTCEWFKLYTELHINDTPELQLLWVYDASGSDYDYGVSSENVAISINGPAYYCSAISNCTLFPIGQTCTPAYSDANCGGTGCVAVGSCN